MAEETRTIKIYERTHTPLKLLAAHYGMTMMDLIDKLVEQEGKGADRSGKTRSNLRAVRTDDEQN